MIRRLFRAVFLAGLVAAGVAAVRALTRDDDPLPDPAAPPTGGPWPPLRNESPAPDETSAPRPTTTPPATEPTEPDVVVAPEPGGVPVADADESAAPWVEPDADGTCPDSHPIKAKMGSKIFHAPGQLNYDRTTPDRCYVDTAAAEADGLRAAKR